MRGMQGIGWSVPRRVRSVHGRTRPVGVERRMFENAVGHATALRQEALDEGLRDRGMTGQLVGHDETRLGIRLVEQALADLFELSKIVRRMVGLAHEEVDEDSQQHRPDIDLGGPAQCHKPIQGLA